MDKQMGLVCGNEKFLCFDKNPIMTNLFRAHSNASGETVVATEIDRK